MDIAGARSASPTYPEVGATRGALPAGYHHVHASAEIGRGADDFERAARTLLGWGMHRGAGLRVESTDETAVTGATVILRLGPAWCAVAAPCRVVYVVDEPHRRGFAYGTLPGHPERGEERFVVEHDPHTGRVVVVVDAFSAAGTRLTRLGGPVNRVVQRVITRRYLDALRGPPRTRPPS
ncbi:DUF1990 family protein [Rhodococcus sp. NPDC127528]|uniref:DUF1990 family protein n=1 Tax=unclassified Rhodococcus (in: high G+C Gram-positive bacteria) TaxID=192944 RepID=UPI0036352958